MKSSEQWHGCPARYATATLFGDQWSMLIMRDMIFKGARHYADFLNDGDGISTNILAARLSHLEAEGIINKQTDPDHGARFIYTLTEKALDTIPAMLEIMMWAEKWDANTEVPKEFVDKVSQNRDAVVAHLRTPHESKS